MSQTYDPLKPISGLPGVGTPFSGLYQIIRDHIAAAISQFSGTAFPAGPVAGQKCYRTDRLTVSGYSKCYTYTGNGALGESGWVEDAIGTALGEEVINARGSKPSLDQRLDVAMNEDGTLKASTSLNPSQWQDMTGHTFTYLTTTSFKIDGDQTDIYKNLRRLKVNLAASMAYSEVVSSSFSAGPNETTVQILDAVLDATLVDVEHSLFLPDKDNGALSSRMTGRRRVKSITFADSPYTTTIHDEIILVDASGGAITVNILAAATMGAGRRQKVIKIDSSTNAVTIDPNAAETINGNANHAISVPLTGIEYESDGSNLRTIDDSADKLSAGDIVQDFVVSGLLGVDPGASLTMVIPAGIAYVLGRRVVKLSGASDLTRTYTVSKDTYVDISHTGAITYTEVTNGAAAPAVAANSLRLMKVVTDGTEITNVTDLRNSFFLLGPQIDVAVIWPGDYTEKTSPVVVPLFPWSSPVKLANPGTLPAGNALGASWSSNGEFLAVAHITTPFVTIYQRSGITFTKLTNPGTLPAGTGMGLHWSPNGEFLAVAHDTTPFVTIYQRSGTTFTKLTDPVTLPASTGNGASWSPNGEFLAITHDSTPFVTIYQRSGTTFTKLANPVTLPASAGNGAFWSSNGEFLAIAHTATPFVTIYQRSGTTFTKLTNPVTLPAGNGLGASWTLNGEFLAVAHATTPFVTIYQTASDMPAKGVMRIIGQRREGI